MFRGMSFVITVPSPIARRLVDPVRSPGERGIILADLLSGSSRWFPDYVKRRGFEPLQVLVTAPETLVQFTVMADCRRRRRLLLRAAGTMNYMTFIKAEPAAPDVALAEVKGIPLEEFWLAQASALQVADELAREWPDDLRVRRVDEGAKCEAVC